MKKWVKWIVRIVLGLFLLLILLIIVIHTAPVKKLIRNKLQAYLSSKIKTEVRIASVNYLLPKWVEVDGVFMRDQVGDTLLYGNKLRLDINMFKLLKGEYEINKIAFGDMIMNISRKEKDSVFNYQFLADAFVSKDTTHPDKKSPLRLSVNQIDITNSSFRYNDRFGGTLMSTTVGSFHITMDSINLSTLQFGINKWDVADMVFDMRLVNMHVPKKIDSVITSENSIPRINLTKLTILRSHFAFNGEALGIRTSNDISEMSLQGLVTRAPMKVTLDKLDLKGSSLLLDQTSSQTSVAAKVRGTNTPVDTLTGKLDLSVKHVELLSNAISYNDFSVKALPKSFDPNRIALRSVTGDVSAITYSSHITKALVKSLSGTDKSGFILDTLHGDIDIRDSIIVLKDVVLKTPGSRIDGNMQLYPATFADNYHGNVQNKIVFHNNVIARKDLALLRPSFTDKYRRQLQGISFVYLNADMTGNAGHLVIKNITAHSDKNDIYVNATGTVSNLRSKNNLQFDLSIAKLTATRNFIEPFINTKGKKQVNMPPSINVTGKVRGNMNVLNNDVVVTSNYGTAAIRGQLKNYTRPAKLSYDLRLVAKNLETGKWVYKDSLFGKLNGTILVKGSGIDYKTADISSVVDIGSFGIRKHLYTGIHLNINGTHGTYDVKGKITDSLARMNLNVHTSLNQQYPTAIGKIDIQNLDLYTLGFYKTPLTIQTNANLQVRDLSPDNLNAFVRLDSTTVYIDKKTFRTDSMILKGIRDSGRTLLTLRSPMADATINGDFKYTEIGDVMQGVIARYNKSQATIPRASNTSASFDMAVDLKPDPVYALLLPGLFFDKNIHATGKIDTKQKDSTLVFYLTAPSFTYGSNHLSNLRANVNGVNDSIKYAILLDTVRSSSLLLYTTSVSGGYANNHLSADIVTNDQNKKPKYALGATASIDKDVYTVQLADRLKINYADWIVDKQNKITYSKQGINVSNFKITKNAESIAVNSTTTAPNAPMDIKVDRFSLSNITGLMNRDSLEIAGVLNAEVKVDGLDKSVPLFNGKIKVDSLRYQGEPVGNLEVNAQNAGEAVTFDGTLTGRGNNVTLKGTYDQSKIDATINLAPMELAAIEPFTKHTLRRSTGKIFGDFTITGDVKSPQWNGSLHFDSTYTQLAKYGTVLKMSGQTIDLKYPVITFNQFTLRDSLEHPFIINGTLTQENGGFTTNLTASTKNFTALDNTAVDNGEIYGKAIVDVDVTVTGAVTAPDINGNLALKAKSQITYVRQQEVASAKDREGVMEFVNIDTMMTKTTWVKDTIITRTNVVSDMLNYNLNIDINKNAEFTVITDPLTRDELHVQGAGQISAAMNPNGDISLTGAYNLTKGSYQLNTKFLKRKFDLQEGSTIVLSGDPKNAEANITAVYDIDATPYDLVANEVSDYSGNDNLYKQKVPFEVVLKITGKLVQPKFSFDIQMKENIEGLNNDMSTTIDNKLTQLRNDASAMNKQVFALLVMGRFIGEQSQDFFAGSNGEGLNADAIVKGSVSRFLSDAVSQLASDLIKGVDVDVDLRTMDNYSDASQRTDLNLALSKRFLNDRLSITVGKSFTVDGEDPLAKGQDNGNVQFLPDITSSYKLSKDGRYVLKAYQKTAYEAILDGYFIETGIAFTLSMDYNKFKEIFQKRKKPQKKSKTTTPKNNTTATGE